MIVGSLEIQMLANMARLTKDMSDAKRVVGNAMLEIERSATMARNALGSLGIGFGVAQLVQLTDRYTRYTSQLKLATKSQQEYNTALADVRRISTLAQADTGMMGVLYARITNSTTQLGISQKKVADITETVGLALKVSGATATESASAMLQLSQAFGSGLLRGEEFNAVNEASPKLMRVLAEAMGVPIGALRELASQGKITSAVMARAFSDPAVIAALREQAKEVQTIQGAFTVLTNKMVDFVGQSSTQSGAVAGLTSAIMFLAENLGTVAKFIGIIIMMKVTDWMARAASAAWLSVAAYRANTLALRESTGAELMKAEAEVARLAVNMEVIASERALVVAQLQTAASTQAAAVATTELAVLGRAQAATAAAQTTATAALTAAQTANAAASVGVIGRASAAVATFVKNNPFTVILAVVGATAYAIHAMFQEAVHGFDELQKKAEAMRLDELMKARQMLVAANAAMKASMFSGFHEADIEKNKRAIMLYDTLINKAQELSKVQGVSGQAPIGTGGDAGHQSRMEQIANELRTRIDSDDKVLSHAERTNLVWLNMADKKKTAEEAVNYRKAMGLAIDLDSIEAARKAIAERDKMAGDIASSIVRAATSGGSFGDALVEDAKRAFAQNVLEPQIKAMVLQSMDVVGFKDAALVANTAATEKNTAAKLGESGTGGGAGAASSAGWWGLLAVGVAAIISSRGSNEKGQTAEQIQALQGIGTVLGELNAKSQSIVNSQEMLTRYDFVATNYLSEISSAMKSVNVNIARLVAGIGKALSLSDMGIQSGLLQNPTLGAGDMGASGWWIPGRSSLMGSQNDVRLEQAMTGLGPFSTGGFADRIRNNSFLRTNRVVSAQGAGATGTLADLNAGRGGYQYATGTDTSTAMWGLYSSSSAWRMQQASAALSTTFGDMFTAIASTVRSAATVLGKDGAAFDDALAAFVFSTGDINLQNMTLAQQTEALNAVMSKQSDILVQSLVPGMLEFQKTGEGLYETLIRVATEVDMTRGLFEILGRTLTDAAVTADTFINALGGVADANKKIGDFLHNFAPDETKLAMARARLESLGLPLLTTTEAWFAYAQQASDEQLAVILNNQSALQAWVDVIDKVTQAAKAMLNTNMFKTLVDYLRAVGRANNVSVAGFADGGVFTNGTYSSPTPFMFADGGAFGVMGEAGPEAVMPLHRDSSGSLGVRVSGGGGNSDTAAAIERLRADLRAIGQTLASNTGVAAKVLRKFDNDGLPAERVIVS